MSRVERDNEIRVEFSYIVFECQKMDQNNFGKIAILVFFSIFCKFQKNMWFLVCNVRRVMYLDQIHIQYLYFLSPFIVATRGCQQKPCTATEHGSIQATRGSRPPNSRLWWHYWLPNPSGKRPIHRCNGIQPTSKYYSTIASFHVFLLNHAYVVKFGLFLGDSKLAAYFFVVFSSAYLTKVRSAQKRRY